MILAKCGEFLLMVKKTYLKLIETISNLNYQNNCRPESVQVAFCQSCLYCAPNNSLLYDITEL